MPEKKKKKKKKRKVQRLQKLQEQKNQAASKYNNNQEAVPVLIWTLKLSNIWTWMRTQGAADMGSASEVSGKVYWIR